MIFIFDNITDKIDFATILVSVFESPKEQKFIFCGKNKVFYKKLISNNKIRANLTTYYPNLKTDFEKLIDTKIIFKNNLESTINYLKKKKYILYGTTAYKPSKNIFEIDISEKSAFIFG